MNKNAFYNAKGEQIPKEEFDKIQKDELNRRIENIKNGEELISEEDLGFYLEQLQKMNRN